MREQFRELGNVCFKTTLANERVPLDRFHLIAAEFVRQGQRQLDWDISFASLEGGFHCSNKSSAVKGKVPGKHVQVVEILHPAIGNAQHDHGLELLGNNRFARACPNSWGRQVQKCGITDLLGFGCNHIAKSHVDLDRNASLAQEGR